MLRPKFRPYFSEGEVAVYLTLFQTTAIQVDDPELTEALSPDPGDDYLVALTEVMPAYLVSGDKHLLGLTRTDLSVLKPAELLKVLKL